MSREKDTGIVLSKRSSGEGDDICVVFTLNAGKERFVFKGLKKSAKRARTGSEPGTTIELVYYTGREGGLCTVSEFDIISSCGDIRKNSEKIYSLWYILELVNLTTGFSDSHPDIFRLLSAAIDTLSTTGFHLHLCVFFTVRFLMIQGILPDTERCSWCGSDSSPIFIEKTGLRASCINCGDIRSASADESGTLLLNLCSRTKFMKIELDKFSTGTVSQLLNSLAGYISSYYNIKLNSHTLLADSTKMNIPG